MHNEQLMDIRREEEMEMSDDDMEDANGADSKDSEDSGMILWTLLHGLKFFELVNMFRNSFHKILIVLDLSHKKVLKPLFVISSRG